MLYSTSLGVAEEQGVPKEIMVADFLKIEVVEFLKRGLTEVVVLILQYKY